VTQYEIWWAQLPPPAGVRPVLLLSREDAYEFLDRFVVAEITRRIRGIPQEVVVGPRESLSVRSAINLDNLHSVHRSQLIRRAGEVAEERQPEIKRALGRALGWPELTIR
jgi:mRNA interferase MazF